MRWRLAVGLIVSCGGDVEPADAGNADGPDDAPVDTIEADALHDAGVCMRDLCGEKKAGCVAFPMFDDSCTTSSDCAIGRHRLDCCGSEIVLGLASSAKAQFDLAEKQWNSGCRSCGCMPMPELTTSGDVCMSYGPAVADCSATDGGVRRCVTRCADASDQ